jgi:tetratricopeptide (TPR) repeat protein
MGFRRFLVPLWVVGLAGACAPRPAPISPAELSDLQARTAREPNNGPLLLRYAAALRAADRCDDAVPVARRGMNLDPKSALGPLVVGSCLEVGERYDDAVATYRAYLAVNPDGRGAGAVRARELLALRAGATSAARQAVAREAELSQQPADPQTLAVLPLRVVGDSTYEPLSRGLAQMLTSDLALLQRFRLVERMRLGALLDEMNLGQTGRVDPATAARVGHLIRAGRMVQGLANIPADGPVRLEASVVQGTGEVTSPAATQGRLRDLLRLEKDIVVGLADRLGYRLSDAERTAILENGTQNLTAFLAYSRGLEAEDRGDYGQAARYYQAAVQADPGFRQAREGFQAATAAPGVQAAGAAEAPVLASQTAASAVAEFVEPVSTALGNTVTDLAPTTVEQVTAITTPTQAAITTTTAQPPPPSVVPPATITGTIRIVFRLP